MVMVIAAVINRPEEKSRGKIKKAATKITTTTTTTLTTTKTKTTKRMEDYNRYKIE